MVKQDFFDNRRANYDALIKAGFNIPYKYDNVTSIKNIRDREISIEPGQILEDKVRVAGTLMGFREHGSLSFLDLHDLTGKIQVYASVDELGDKYSGIKHLDLGDIIGVDGKIMKTKRGELSVRANDLALLAKCFYPMPNLRDPLNIEVKYRQRYIDLKLNPETRQTFVKRSQGIAAMREFLDGKNFIEVEIPLVQPVYGGASAKPFVTKVNALDQDWFLSISPETYLKRLIVGGMERVYTITKNFRNESIDTTHNPEFTMMECYQAYADLYDTMKLTEDVIAHMAKKVAGSTKIKFGDKEIDLTPPFRRLTMEDAVKQYADIDISKIPDDALRNIVETEELDFSGRQITKPNVIHALFEKYVEGKLEVPTFIHDYPVDISPLTRIHRDKPGWVERFELYIDNMEIANAYSELVDPFDQKERLEQQEKERLGGSEDAHPMDEDFVTALMHGLPPTGGLGIGIDRVIMLLTNNTSIKDIILFPMMRREGK